MSKLAAIRARIAQIAFNVLAENRGRYRDIARSITRNTLIGRRPDDTDIDEWTAETNAFADSIVTNLSDTAFGALLTLFASADPPPGSSGRRSSSDGRDLGGIGSTEVTYYDILQFVRASNPEHESAPAGVNSIPKIRDERDEGLTDEQIAHRIRQFLQTGETKAADNAAVQSLAAAITEFRQLRPTPFFDNHFPEILGSIHTALNPIVRADIQKEINRAQQQLKSR